jgi:hypothetical protein
MASARCPRISATALRAQAREKMKMKMKMPQSHASQKGELRE